MATAKQAETIKKLSKIAVSKGYIEDSEDNILQRNRAYCLESIPVNAASEIIRYLLDDIREEDN